MTGVAAPRAAAARREPAPAVWGPWLRLAAFVGLAGLASAYWASFVADAPAGDILAVLLIATALGAGLIALDRVRVPALVIHAAGALVTLAALALGLVAAGLDASLLQPARWDDFAALIDRGFDGLRTISWPYDGPDEAVRLTVLLAIPPVLVLAAAFAFWPVRKHPGFDSVALVLLIAFYTVAITDQDFGGELGRGVVLLALIAAWLWLPHLGRRGAAAGAAAIAVAGLLALPVAAALQSDEPWVDYTTWAIGSDEEASATFDWNHAYGPLDWPRSGRTLLAVRSEDPHYWKAETLDHFDGLRWTHRRSRLPLTAELPASFEPRWDERISFTVRDLRSDVLIGAGTVLDTEGDLGISIPSGDGTIRLIDEPLEQGDSYTVRAYVPDPSAAAMRAAADDWSESLRKYVGFTLPDRGNTAIEAPTTRSNTQPYAVEHQVSLPFRGEAQERYDRATVRQIRRSPYARTYALARSLAKGQPTTYDVVRNTERWLQRELRYSERVPTRPYPLAGFLFEDKVGYCQQFSGAMALMLRMNGIPARVAGGFAPGIYDQATREYRVRDLDAHSWVEVYFDDIGWVPFDPTPSAAPAEAQAAGSDSASAARGGSERAAEGTRQREESASAGPAVAGSGGSTADWWIVPVVLLALAALAVAAFWLYVVAHERRHRRATPADARLAELRSALERMGHDVSPQTTLAALERRLRALAGPASARYVAMLRRARYGPPGEREPGRGDRAALRRELARAGGRLGRVRAFLALPPRAPG